MEKPSEIFNAIEEANLDTLKSCLRNPAAVNQENAHGWKPLHLAAQLGDVGAATLLLHAGANPNDLTLQGSTPLHLAVHNGHPEIVKLLLLMGANPTCSNKFGRTPLDLADLFNQGEATKSLLREARINSLTQGSFSAGRTEKERKGLFAEKLLGDQKRNDLNHKGSGRLQE